MNKQEELWSGEFGDAYNNRNEQAGRLRGGFFSEISSILDGVVSVCEFGCGTGENIRHLVELFPEVWGIDINQDAVNKCRERYPETNVCRSSVLNTPFTDHAFGLTITCGLLIHQKPGSELEGCMSEIARCSSDYLLCMEYESPSFSEIIYRGQRNALWRGPYAEKYLDLGFSRVKGGELTKQDGFDNVTWTLLRR